MWSEPTKWDGGGERRGRGLRERGRDGRNKDRERAKAMLGRRDEEWKWMRRKGERGNQGERGNWRGRGEKRDQGRLAGMCLKDMGTRWGMRGVVEGERSRVWQGVW